LPVSAYWDKELVSLALSIPSKLKIKKGNTKYILRKAASRGIDPYWDLSKIGLQNAFAFILKGKNETDWYSERVKDVKSSWLFEVVSNPYSYTNFERLVLVEEWW